MNYPKFPSGCHAQVVVKGGIAYAISDTGFDDAFNFAKELGYKYWSSNYITPKGIYVIKVIK